jgi:E3 ubiquitin-protein ligase listerin
MMPLIMQSPSISFSHISHLGGAIALINSSDQPQNKLDTTSFDQNGYSPAIRIARYIVKLFRHSSLVDLARPEQVIILKNLALVHQSASQNLYAYRPNPPTGNLNADRAPERLDISADMDHMLEIWEESEPTTDLSLIPIVQQQLLDDSRGTSPASYYSTCAFLFLESEYIEHSRFGGLKLKASSLEPLRKSSDIFIALATWKLTTDAELIVKALNDVLAALIGYEFEKQTDAGKCCHGLSMNRLY